MSYLPDIRADIARKQAEIYKAMLVPPSYLMPRGPIPVLPFDLEMNPMTAPAVDKPLPLPIKLLVGMLAQKTNSMNDWGRQAASAERNGKQYRVDEANSAADVDALKKALKKLGHKV